MRQFLETPGIKVGERQLSIAIARSFPASIMLVSLTVGKVDAGMAVLLTDDKRIVRPPPVSLQL
jgi:hypothetical protein